MKKIIYAFLVLLTIIVGSGVASAEVDGLEYVVCDETATVTITSVDSNVKGEITVPESIEGYPVTTIGEGAFSNCISLTKVNLPDTITVIEDYAFELCFSLTEITLPTGIERIGIYAFDSTGYYNNDNNWDNGVMYIGEYLIMSFSETESYTVKEGTRLIADEAFSYNSSLAEIKFPETLTFIGSRAFEQCEGLTSVTLPLGLTGIGEGAFEGCCNLTEVYTLNRSLNYQFGEEVSVINGTKQLPYILRTAADLHYLSKIVNDGFTCEGYYFKLEGSINMQGCEWMPIGKQSAPFMGNFNGNNCSVYNFKVTEPHMDNTYLNTAGFFGFIRHATIEKLSVDIDIYIKNPKYNTYAGCMVGFAEVSVIDDCSALGNVEMLNYNEQALEVYIGGLVGSFELGQITNCDSGGYINYYGDKNTTEGTGATIGGIVAWACSLVDKCTSYSDIFASGIAKHIGGITGYQAYGFGNDAYTSNCLSYGNITIVRAYSDYCFLACGGIVGYDTEGIDNCDFYADIAIYYDGKVYDSANFTGVSSNQQPHCGQIYGLIYSNTAENCTSGGRIYIKKFNEFFPRAELIEVESTKYDGNKYDYNILIKAQDNVDGMLIICFYNRGNNVGNVVRDVETVENIAIVSGSVEFDEEAVSYTAYFWDKGNMRPYSLVYSMPIVKESL